MRVMIVDDHAGVRSLIRQLLTAPDDVLIECATGEDAVKVARDFKPDYVTMDIRLPDLRGLEAAAAIRAIHPPSRVVIVTSYDQPFLRQIAEEMGAFAFVLKDNLSELRSVLVRETISPRPSGSGPGREPGPERARAVTNPASPGPASSAPTEASINDGNPPAPSGTHAPLRFLMVEDSENDCELICRHLRRCGFEFLAKRVATESELRRALEEDRWDIAFTDGRLPLFSAIEAMEMIRQLGLNMPMLCVTGTKDPAKVAAFLRAGACEIINKDDLSGLCAAVRRALNLKDLC